MHPARGGFILTKAQLQTLQSNPISFEERVDISSVKVDMALPALQRAEQYLAQIKNPYAFKCAGIAVDIEFCEGGKSLEQAIHTILILNHRQYPVAPSNAFDGFS